MTTTPLDPDVLPTDADVAFYREHGYWISPPLLPDDVLAAAARGMARLYAGERDHALPDGRTRWGWRPEDGDVLRKNDYASLLVDELAALVRHPLVAACAARLSGAGEIRLWHDQLLYKPADRAGGAANVGWHTDRQYWRTCSSTAMLTAWIPFHDVTAAAGAVRFVDGSHRWAEEDTTFDFFDPDLSVLDRLRDRYEVREVAAEVPRGAMSFHHCRTVHGSGPNLSGAPRRSIAVHLQPGDNHHVPFTRPDGTPGSHGSDVLLARTPDGRPDYADPAVCPRLWPPA